MPHAYVVYYKEVYSLVSDISKFYSVLRKVMPFENTVFWFVFFNPRGEMSSLHFSSLLLLELSATLLCTECHVFTTSLLNLIASPTSRQFLCGESYGCSARVQTLSDALA